jgi:hypothetical protein
VILKARRNCASAPVARAAVLFAALFSIESRAAVADPPRGFLDGDFERWKDGKPVEWRVETGATTGAGPASRVEQLEGGGAALAGDAATKTWWMLAQTLDIERGRSYRLRFEARAMGLHLDPGQQFNAYVGVMARGAASFDITTLRAETTFRDRWTPCATTFHATTSQADVVAFLSLTGRLEVRAMRWEALVPEQSFDVLVEHMDRHYSFFAERGAGLDWLKHAAGFRERAMKATDAGAFAAVVSEMLAPLHDPHVSIRTADGTIAVPGVQPVDAGFDARATARRLMSPRQVGQSAITGIASSGVGYVAIGALPSDPAGAAALIAAVAEHTTGKAIILDLRPNMGGFEETGRVIASMFTDTKRVYARRRFRSGPAHDDFGPWIDAEIAPRSDARFAGPVVVILGPGCASSGEGLAQMLAVIPTVTTIGRPTRGASGNPSPIDLPNGVSVGFSRWQDALPDGTLLEGHGVVPKIAMDATGADDPTFHRAVELALDAIRAKDAKPVR